MRLCAFSTVLFLAFAPAGCKDELLAERERLESLHARELADERGLAERRVAELHGQLSSCYADLEAAHGVPGPGRRYEIAIGDRVVVMNRASLDDGQRRFHFGDDCRIDPGGSFLIVAATLAGGGDPWVEYLARYAKPPAGSDAYVDPRDDAPPYACPDGTMFLHEDPLGISEPPP
jgi:hypothetical protein